MCNFQKLKCFKNKSRLYDSHFSFFWTFFNVYLNYSPLVRMRSPVRIWVAAPKRSDFSWNQTVFRRFRVKPKPAEQSDPHADPHREKPVNRGAPMACGIAVGQVVGQIFINDTVSWFWNCLRFSPLPKTDRTGETSFARLPGVFLCFAT